MFTNLAIVWGPHNNRKGTFGYIWTELVMINEPHIVLRKTIEKLKDIEPTNEKYRPCLKI